MDPSPSQPRPAAGSASLLAPPLKRFPRWGRLLAWALSAVLLAIDAAPKAHAQITPVIRYPVAPGVVPQQIVAGPDQHMWYSERTTSPAQSGVVRLNLDGTLSEQHHLSPWAVPTSLGAGPDGNVWASPWGDTITRIQPDGGMTTFTAPASLGSYSSGIAAGPDGHVWMVMRNGLARITPDGTVTAVPIDAGNPALGLAGAVVTGPDGHLWVGSTFPMYRLYRVDAATGAYQTYDYSAIEYTGISSLAAGPDGQVWFIPAASQVIGKIDPATGQITTYRNQSAWVNSITAGPDGNMWYVTGPYWGNSVIGRITPDGQAVEYPLPPNTKAYSITTGPDGKLWYLETVEYPGGAGLSYNVATFGIPVTVRSTGTGVGGSITPAVQGSRIGATAQLSLALEPGALIDSLLADRCGPLITDASGTLSTATLTSDCQVSARFTVPQCDATPTEGFADTLFSYSCTGLPRLGQLSLDGGRCEPVADGQASCSATLGASDGMLGISDGYGNQLIMASSLTLLSPAACNASPATAFAGTQIVLICNGLPPGARLDVQGAACDPPDDAGTLTCRGTLGSDAAALGDNPLAVTRLADGSSAATLVTLNTLAAPPCLASPNPVRSGESVRIQCPTAPAGSVVQVLGARCQEAKRSGTSCVGTAGHGPSDIGPDPAVRILYAGGQATGQVALTIDKMLEPETPGTDPGAPPDGSLQAIPALHPAALVLLALGLGGLFRLGRRPA